MLGFGIKPALEGINMIYFIDTADMVAIIFTVFSNNFICRCYWLSNLLVYGSANLYTCWLVAETLSLHLQSFKMTRAHISRVKTSSFNIQHKHVQVCCTLRTMRHISCLSYELFWSFKNALQKNVSHTTVNNFCFCAFFGDVTATGAVFIPFAQQLKQKWLLGIKDVYCIFKFKLLLFLVKAFFVWICVILIIDTYTESALDCIIFNIRLCS